MHESIQTIMTLFGLMPDTTTMTVGDALVYMVLAMFSIVSIMLLFKFFYGILTMFMSGGGKL